MAASIQGMFLSSNDFTQSYNDQGSSSDCDVQFWSPNPPDGWLPLGDVCEASPSDWIYGSTPRGQILVVAPLSGTVGALKNPSGFTQIWKDTGSGATLNGAVWQMIPPAGFVAIGHVVTFSSSGDPPTPNTNDYYCVASSLVTQAQLGPQIWDDAGSGADVNVGIWRLVPSSVVAFQDAGTFFATTSHNPGPVTASVLAAGVVDFGGASGARR